MKKIAILGSTGSIGTQSLDVISKYSDRYEVVALACGKNVDLLMKQISAFRPSLVSVLEEADAKKVEDFCRSQGLKTEVAYGREGAIAVATSDCDMVISAFVGASGLEPTYAAINAGKDIALANKETLVMGGELIMSLAREKGVKILPVDSEHSAIFQSLEGNQGRKIRRILLTSSGGPFRGKSLDDLKTVTLEQALNHPSWSMGNKITIDSATMMNKGFEVIEARWLFDVMPKDIQILVHPECVLHSAVEFCDGSIIGQMATADMRLPISLALAYPDRLDNISDSVDFFGKASNLTFEAPHPEVFKCITYAYEAAEKGGAYPVVLNAANEVLVHKFLNRKISFLAIQEGIEKALNEAVATEISSIEQIIDIDRKTREIVK